VVNAGGALGPNFTAGWGSTLDVRLGGVVGNNLEIVGTADISGGLIGQDTHAYSGSRVTISGGSIGTDFNAFDGSEVNISGGAVGSGLRARRGSVVSISGGSVGAELIADEGSQVNISGGVIGNGLSAQPGSQVNISGGSIGTGLIAFNGSELNISGGRFGGREYSDYYARSGSTVNLFGRQFLINGVPVEGLSPGQPLVFTERNGTLSGILADGSPFSFLLASSIPGPRPTPRGIFGTLTLTLVPEPSTAFQLAPIAFAVPLWIRARRRQA
jgi:hypothetical protein